MGLCRLLPIPAGRWSFPTLSLHSLCRCLDPYPGMSPLCSRPFLPEVQRPSPKVQGARPIQISPQRSFNGVSKFRGCSHSLMFRPPHSLDPPAAPTAGISSRAAGPSTPRTPRGQSGSLLLLCMALASTTPRRLSRHTQAHYRLGRAHPWPGGIRTRWTTNEVSWSHRSPPIPFDQQGLVAL